MTKVSEPISFPVMAIRSQITTLQVSDLRSNMQSSTLSATRIQTLGMSHLSDEDRLAEKMTSAMQEDPPMA